MEPAICIHLGLFLSLIIMLVRFIPVAYSWSLFLFIAVTYCLYHCMAMSIHPTVDEHVACSHLGFYRIPMNMYVLYPDAYLHAILLGK